MYLVIDVFSLSQKSINLGRREYYSLSILYVVGNLLKYMKENSPKKSVHGKKNFNPTEKLPRGAPRRRRSPLHSSASRPLRSEAKTLAPATAFGVPTNQRTTTHSRPSPLQPNREPPKNKIPTEKSRPLSPIDPVRWIARRRGRRARGTGGWVQIS
jgi:hypothetical protein